MHPLETRPSEAEAMGPDELKRHADVRPQEPAVPAPDDLFERFRLLLESDKGARNEFVRAVADILATRAPQIIGRTPSAKMTAILKEAAAEAEATAYFDEMFETARKLAANLTRHIAENLPNRPTDPRHGGLLLLHSGVKLFLNAYRMSS